MNIAVPPGYPNAFTYIITKVATGCNKAMMSFYPQLMQVCELLNSVVWVGMYSYSQLHIMQWFSVLFLEGDKNYWV